MYGVITLYLDINWVQSSTVSLYLDHEGNTDTIIIFIILFDKVG